MISHRSPAFLRGNGGVHTAVRPAGQLFGMKAVSGPGMESGPSPSIVGPQPATTQTMGPQSAVNSNALLQNNQSPTNFTPPQPAAQYRAVATAYNLTNPPPITQQQPVYPPTDTGIPWGHYRRWWRHRNRCNHSHCSAVSGATCGVIYCLLVPVEVPS